MILEGFQKMIVEIVPLDTTVKNLVLVIPPGFALKASFVWKGLHHLHLVKGNVQGNVQGHVQLVIFVQKEQKKVFIFSLSLTKWNFSLESLYLWFHMNQHSIGIHLIPPMTYLYEI